MIRSALQSRCKWQQIDKQMMPQRIASGALSALINNWIRGAASRHISSSTKQVIWAKLMRLATA